LFWDILSLMAAILAIVFSNRIARKVIQVQNSVWGFNLSNRAIKFTKIIIIIMAGFFMVLSLLALFGILEWWDGVMAD